MSDRPDERSDARFEERARRAGAAVQGRAGARDPREGLDAVVRRGRRPRPGTAIGIALLALLAVPAIAWLGGIGEPEVRFGEPGTPPTDDPGGIAEPTELDDPEQPDPSASEIAPPDADPTPTPTAQPDEGATPGPEPAGEFGMEEVNGNDFPYGGGEYATLTDVRLARHEGFDRVVLELDGPDMPSYRVTYIEPPIIQDGSGEEIEVEGRAFLELRATPAAGVESVGTEWVRTYTGPERLSGDTAVVTEMVLTGNFEANLAWVVGLRSEQPFAVTTLSDPLRLVVDIRHP